MDQQILTNIIYVTIFLIGALLFGFGPIIIVKLLSPSSHTRNISNNMRPSGLKEFGLSVALQDFCQQIMDNYPVKIHCLLDLQQEHYKKTVEIYLFRIAQEAANNVLKHAGASEIHLSLEEIDNHLFFTLLDNGCGFDQNNPDLHRGNGLLNMKERVDLLNGYFELTTAPGKGTRIDIDISLL